MKLRVVAFVRALVRAPVERGAVKVRVNTTALVVARTVVIPDAKQLVKTERSAIK